MFTAPSRAIAGSGDRDPKQMCDIGTATEAPFLIDQTENRPSSLNLKETAKGNSAMPHFLTPSYHVG